MYQPISKVDEDTLSFLGSEVILNGHTGSMDSKYFTFAGSGIVTLRFSWITDDIDQLDEAGNFHYGCFVGAPATEKTDELGMNGGYTYGDGTSFSSPLVAGALALGMSYNPSITPLELKDIILKS